MSLPLILISFLAAGLAIALLTADLLDRTDVTGRVLQVSAAHTSGCSHRVCSDSFGL
jgi:hypothetical protein